MDLRPSSTTTTGLIGYNDLQPEPCDGTGMDAMAQRYRKWHKGEPAVPQKPIDHAALGAFIYNLCSSDTEAQRLVALWEQSIRIAHEEPAMGEVDLPDAAAEIAKPTAAAEQMVEAKVAEPAAKIQPDENNNKTFVYTYDSVKYRDSYPLCNAKYRTGLGAAYKKMMTAAPAGAVQRGPGGPPRGPGGPPRGPGGPPRPNGNHFGR